MFGFVIGTLCLIGLIKVLRGGFRRGYGCGGWSGRSCGSGGYGGWGHHGGHGHDGYGGRDHGAGWDRSGPFWMRGMFERLGTTQAQEKVIRDAFEEAWRSARDLREEGRASREDIAKAVRSASFDEVVMGEMFARHDNQIEKVRKEMVGVIGKVHAVLDDKQREILAQMIERGPFGGGFRGGPFRTAWA
ncbi:MAG: periplasmic heavy metal sensor [Polyangiaceae bacterium]|nr:periplasmic heavy metal sensor [Polyangiaceae bacterium]